MSGTLFICATPIGNLKDITLRVLETLKAVDLIAAEDTRHTLKLLSHFDIHKPLTSYFEHNQQEKGAKIIDALLQGKNVALVSDAGTPVISDPGASLVLDCIEKGIEVESLPGPCAAIMAMTLSGLSNQRFLFEGFLPAKKQEKIKRLEEMKNYPFTMVFYEAPHKLKLTLSCMLSVFSDRQISIHREMTKKFEETLRLSLSQALAHFEEKAPMGEFVLVVSGSQEEAPEKVEFTLTLAQQVAYYMEEGLEKKEAIKRCAQERGLPKREVYQAVFLDKNN